MQILQMYLLLIGYHSSGSDIIYSIIIILLMLLDCDTRRCVQSYTQLSVSQLFWCFNHCHLNFTKTRVMVGRDQLPTPELCLLWYTFIRTTQTQTRKRILTKEKSISGRGGCVVLMKPTLFRDNIQLYIRNRKHISHPRSVGWLVRPTSNKSRRILTTIVMTSQANSSHNIQRTDGVPCDGSPAFDHVQDWG